MNIALITYTEPKLRIYVNQGSCSKKVKISCGFRIIFVFVGYFVATMAFDFDSC